MMVRERGRCVRQLSLEGPVRGPLRRQVSEDLRPGPLKIAWAIETPPESNVQVVAKKCGQPKPSVVKPPRSPFLPDQNTVLFSRQQLTERLRSSWKKKNGRHNLNIFLNQSIDSDTDPDPRPRTPDTSDDETSDKEISQAPETPPEREKLCASDRRMNFRNAGRQKVIESPCPTPEPRKPVQRMMSAPTRAPLKKLTKAPSLDNQRVKSAPPKRKLKPSTRKKTKGEIDEDEKNKKKGIRRGVERGEIITMVSLVSPAESDSDEPICIQLAPNPTPPPPSLKEEPKPPPPPPIICLKKSPKAVTFRPAGVIQNGTQFQTNYTLKRTTSVQQTSSPLLSSPNLTIRPSLQRQGTAQAKISSHSAQNPVTTEQQIIQPRHPPLLHQTTVIKRKPSVLLTQPVIKIEPTQNKSAEVKAEAGSTERPEEKESEDYQKPTVPDFKSQKERECWELFKKMSESGVSVSFETVLSPKMELDHEQIEKLIELYSKQPALWDPKDKTYP